MSTANEMPPIVKRRLRTLLLVTAMLLSVELVLGTWLGQLTLRGPGHEDDALWYWLPSLLWIPALFAFWLPRSGAAVYAALAAITIVLFRVSSAPYHVSWADTTSRYAVVVVATLFLIVNASLDADRRQS